METPLLSSGSWCAQCSDCALQASVSPILWKFCNQIPLASKVKFPGGSQSLGSIPRLENMFMGPRTFLTVQEFVWYNCSAVDGSSARQFYGGINGDLLHEGLCHTQDCCTQSPCPCGRPLLTHTSTRDTQALKDRSGSVSVGSLGPGTHQVLFEPSSVSGGHGV